MARVEYLGSSAHFPLTGSGSALSPVGSGDRALDYVLVFVFAAVATLAAAVWSAFDRRPNYVTLEAWLRLLVRYTLSFTLLTYGFAKVVPLQFPAPFLAELTETYGESSPMRVLWTFMGASSAYTCFCGSVEVLAGLLLLFRRTATLGAAVAAAAMLNVVLLNYCYDVDVKLYSTHLLAMALFLLGPNAPALARLFVLDETARLESPALPPFPKRWPRLGSAVVHGLVVVCILYNNISLVHDLMKKKDLYRPRSPLYGIWNAEAEGGKWRQLSIEFARAWTVRTIDGQRVSFTTKYDEARHTVTVNSAALKQNGEISYEQPDGNQLTLRGAVGGETINAKFSRVDTSKMLLLSRGFHWVNEDPFNR